MRIVKQRGVDANIKKQLGFSSLSPQGYKIALPVSYFLIQVEKVSALDWTVSSLANDSATPSDRQYCKMCKIHVTTTRYTKCPPSCTTVKSVLVSYGCPTYAATGNTCRDPKEVNLGQTITRGECQEHKDEGFADYDTRWQKGVPGDTLVKFYLGRLMNYGEIWHY